MARFYVRNADNTAWIEVPGAGATGPAGPEGLVWKGAWSSATAYVIDDAVESGGSAYICILGHTNHVPPNATYWQLLASKGAKGDTGATGAAGEVQSQDDTSTDHAIARFHGTSGHYIQNSGVTIDDSGNMLVGSSAKIYLRDTSTGYLFSPQANYVGLNAASMLRFDVDGTQRWYVSSDKMAPYGNKVYDLGLSNWDTIDDCYADDFHNVADVPYLDDRDDLATIMAIARGERVNERSGLPLIDDATLPEWLLSKDKTDGKTILRDEAGSPWVSTNNWVGLLLGAVRELTRRTEAQQAEIDALKAAVKALQGARRA